LSKYSKMNLREIDELIIFFQGIIPQGNTKATIINTCLNIHKYVEEFQSSGDLSMDIMKFDEYFYGKICDDWCEEVSLYTIDDPRETFPDLFKEFRAAAHQCISNGR